MSSNALLWPSQGTKPEERLDKYKWLRLPSQGFGGVAPPAQGDPLLAIFPPLADNTFQFYKFYQINKNQAFGSEVNKPLVIIDTLPPGILQEASGLDIRAFDSTGTPIPYQYQNVTINPDTSADIIIWINAPLVKDGEFIQLTFGKPTATNGQSTTTWNSNYLAALHLNEISDGTITEIIDATGDGTNTLEFPLGVATDSSGNVYVTGFISTNAFKITPGGTITEIIDSTGDGTGNTLTLPQAIAVDSSGNVFVAGNGTNNVFKITPGGTITQIIDSTGDGTNPLTGPRGLATDSSGNVFVAGIFSDNVFKITPGGTITEIIDSTGDGTNILTSPQGVAVDSSGNVFVAGSDSDNVFKIDNPTSCSTGGTPCTITEIIDSTGDGTNTLELPLGVATDSSGNVYVTGEISDNVFKITPGGTKTQIIDSTGDGTNILNSPQELVVDSSGNVFVAGNGSDNVFKIDNPTSCSTGGTPCTITEIIDSTGDGTNILNGAIALATDSSDNVFVTGRDSDNAFKITPSGAGSIKDSTSNGNDGTPVNTPTQVNGQFGKSLQFDASSLQYVDVPTISISDTITVEATINVVDASVDQEIVMKNPVDEQWRLFFENNLLKWNGGVGTAILNGAQAVAVDSSDNVFVAGGSSDNVFKITPNGGIAEIIDSTGDGTGNILNNPINLATDSLGNMYVVGIFSNNAFKITPAGVITEIIDSTGDGTNPLTGGRGIAVDSIGNVFVSGGDSDNAFKITPGGVITQIIDSTGDGTNPLDLPVDVIAVDSSGNLFVTGFSSNNAFKITPAGVITQIIDSTGDGTNPLTGPQGVAVDSLGNVFVVGRFSDNVFKITPGGTITEIIDSTGDGAGNPLGDPFCVTTDSLNNVYVTGLSTNNVFKITPSGTKTEIIDNTGDGTGNTLIGARGVAVDSSDNVYVTGQTSDNAFKIDNPTSCSTGGTPCTITEIIDPTGDAASAPLSCTPPSNNTFHDIVAVQTGNSVELFIDGVSCGISSIPVIGNGAGTINIARFDNSNFFDGIIGGIKISDIKLTSDWIKTTFNNKNDNNAFWFETPILENGVDNFLVDDMGRNIVAVQS